MSMVIVTLWLMHACRYGYGDYDSLAYVCMQVCLVLNCMFHTSLVGVYFLY